MYRLSVCLSVYVSVCLCPNIGPSVFLTVPMCVYLFVCMSVFCCGMSSCLFGFSVFMTISPHNHTTTRLAFWPLRQPSSNSLLLNITHSLVQALSVFFPLQLFGWIDIFLSPLLFTHAYSSIYFNRVSSRVLQQREHFWAPFTLKSGKSNVV